MKKALIIITVLLIISQARLGVDIAYFNDEVTVDQAKCFLKNNITYAIVEVGLKDSTYAIHSPQTILNLKAAGFKYIDIYIYPDLSALPQPQVYAMFQILKSFKADVYNNVWIDVEQNKLDPWSKICSVNQLFLAAVIQEAVKEVGKDRVGIYSSNHYWEPFLCNTTLFSQYKLWWPRWDNQTNFDSFEEFGGWKTPTMKQYQPFTWAKEICGFKLDQDYVETSSDSCENSDDIEITLLSSSDSESVAIIEDDSFERLMMERVNGKKK